MSLRWEPAGTDEPLDQNADSDLGPHAYWSLGPAGLGAFAVELIARDDDLNEIPAEGVHLGHFASEAAAKAAAEKHESTGGDRDGRRG